MGGDKIPIATVSIDEPVGDRKVYTFEFIDMTPEEEEFMRQVMDKVYFRKP